MPLTFSQFRLFNNDEIPVTINRSAINLPTIEIKRINGSQEINSIKVEIIDNKPLYIPLGKTGMTYKGQFKTFTILDFNAWYTVLGNDVLKVVESDYNEFPVNSYWNVESITFRELQGSSYAILDTDEITTISPGEQSIIFEYEIELNRSSTNAIGVPRET